MTTTTSQEQEGTGRVPATIEAQAERDDWSWMVAEDPAFVLEGCDTELG